MNIYKKAIFVLVLFASAPLLLTAQELRTTKEEYIDRYKRIAVEHMERYGIPASITMAQGLLESDAGNSWLARASNNHFGIKCKRDWRGDRVYYDDDAENECFRSYPSVEASYRDHAEFLDTQPRYDSLFAYAPTDYRSWARGLKAAGYATAPDYAQRLVRIIEEYRLYLLDREDGLQLYAEACGRSSDPMESFAGQSTVDRPATADAGIDPDAYRVTINAHCGYNVYMTNGVHYILAKEGDTFERIGELFRLSPRNLRRFNDLRGEVQPIAGEVLYIERKKRRWEGNARIHTARAGETAYSVGQSYALRTRSVERLNGIRHGEEFAPGSQVRIR